MKLLLLGSAAANMLWHGKLHKAQKLRNCTSLREMPEHAKLVKM